MVNLPDFSQLSDEELKKELSDLEFQSDVVNAIYNAALRESKERRRRNRGGDVPNTLLVDAHNEDTKH